VRSLVIVILDPEGGAFHGLFEAVELSPLEKLTQDRFPKALDLAQRHGMVGAGTDVLDAVLFHLPFEAGLSPPVGVLSAVVGKHLFGNAVLGNATTIGLQHMGRRLAAVQSQGGDVTAVIIHEADQIGVAPCQPEGHDIALPHLIRAGAFEKARLGRVPDRFAFRLVHHPLFR
jgi:hypothetical protein